ncbi:M4 family metallopeptidase [Sinomonas halotolerans]|uniref:Neutral metalloproteinase n=1 Tax=Sinomonas halotolerans TaxID=1644133 RepID=A0ABU9WX41_9MICC
MSRSEAPVRHQGAVPPYLLEHLAHCDGARPTALPGRPGAATGTPDRTAPDDTPEEGRQTRVGLDVVAELARRTLLADERMRRQRERPPHGPHPGILARPGTLRREISDAENTERLPGTIARKEGQIPVDDADVNRAYDGLGSTYRFLEEIFEQSSIDGAGLALEGTVHYGVGYDNAFWDGSRMVFGDGDGKVFGSFTTSLSIIAHELGHGLLQNTTDLTYRGQSGALNESFADVFGVLVEQFSRAHGVEEASWVVGEGIFMPGIKGTGVRSLKAPGTAYDDPMLGKDPQPGHMDDYVRTREDNGGVHVNSGIPNHAFYLTAAELGGKAWEKAGKIWFHTIALRKLDVDVDFRGFARETVRAARSLYGRESAEEKAVRAGWRGVGITVRLTDKNGSGSKGSGSKGSGTNGPGSTGSGTNGSGSKGSGSTGAGSGKAAAARR